ncbi:uncharacterized protein FA14DRAFT_160054 [Meira miltonrushii]|uniref:Uncharacterized protein n=1 Tax=Meira miltonrushii TaxID=1280837 RepID=A0A316VNE3_9BASI|nr:uncharacterized protein FA14DRAFT_160054 [Meira miltonrushii]PWN38588.1 hypothetical protein FA14DRAFT_160054 [Meira miltonrushii]
MKFITPLLISLTIFGGVCLAASAANNGTSTASCTPTYKGKLHVTDLSELTNTANEDQRGYRVDVISGEEHDHITKQWSRGASDFIFEKCVLKGWNSGSKEYGTLKVDEFTVTNHVVTAEKRTDQLTLDGETYTGHILRFHTIGTPQSKRLDKQWFEAKHQDDKAGGAYVTLELTGNPNNKNADYDLPNAFFGTYDKNGLDRVLVTKSNTNYKLTVFDVKKL